MELLGLNVDRVQVQLRADTLTLLQTLAGRGVGGLWDLLDVAANDATATGTATAPLRSSWSSSSLPSSASSPRRPATTPCC